MQKKNKTLLEIVTGSILTLSSIYAVNQLLFYLASRKEQLYDSHGTYYQHNQGKIYYTKSGNGTPLLLIHDLNSCSSTYEWHEVIKHFSKKHTVYAIDLLGCGKSDKPRITYTSYLYVQVLTDFIQEVICDTPDVIVTGNAVPHVMMVERMHPGTFSHMIFCNPLDFEDAGVLPNQIDTYRKHILETPILGTLYYNICTSRSAIFKRFRMDYLANGSKCLLTYIRHYHEAAHLKGSNSKFLFASQRCHYLGCHVADAYQDIHTPTCVILGEAMEYPAEFTDSSVFLSSDTEVAIIPDSRYLPQVEAPEVFVNICETYLAKNTLD